ncbi:myeloid differentiation primary response protein MyD88-A-like isoform X2 [Linepithema humile]|uniref:myeloid differentiation primary response protein MyD88-A-like isoform X2 n=1 Tax=Linepithema humile TaxID=83485 RepID=UPI0006236BFB|nr:PREDICTED: myeloid differentiation primary response protein MyD88-A-like isoform X2 [Linepithema humile]
MTSDLSTVPFVALSAETKEYIANMLNPTKFLSNENRLQRDWRGLTCFLEDKINADIMPWHEFQTDPTNYILEKIEKNITIKDFQARMELMDRWDIIDDTQKMFESDAVKYFEQQYRANSINQQIEDDILTLDDANRVRRGLSKAHYDAFLLYANEDADFAKEIMEKLRTEYKLKLCCYESMIPCLRYVDKAMMTLISKRCNKLLVILSPDFLRYPTNQSLLNYAHVLSFEKQERKIVPCLYKSCQQENMPYHLQYISCVDYTRRRYQDFWMLLFYSIQAPNDDITSTIISVYSHQYKMIQKLTEINTLPDKRSDIIQTTQKTDEETSIHSLQSENYVTRDDIALNNENEKIKRSFLEMIKDLSKMMTKSNRENLKSNQSNESQDQFITETTILCLPSVDDLSKLSKFNSLSSLSLSSNDICKNKKII